jgi:2-polyprenyl-3-methyl-5-hydroxy-6-metoxy-1,4-benzoquinol methylase
MLLRDARVRGATVVGVELSAEAAGVAIRDFALDIRVGALEDVQDRLGVFDVAIACEVIEHVLEPTSFLKRLASIVVPHGHVLLSTPNYSCARRFGEAWFGFQASFEHLYFLSEEVLSRIAATVGLRELCWFTCGSGLVTGGTAPALKRFVKRLGLESAARMVKAKLSRRLTYEAYGHGHTLVALFQKTDTPGPIEG